MGSVTSASWAAPSRLPEATIPSYSMVDDGALCKVLIPFAGAGALAARAGADRLAQLRRDARRRALERRLRRAPHAQQPRAGPLGLVAAPRAVVVVGVVGLLQEKRGEAALDRRRQHARRAAGVAASVQLVEALEAAARRREAPHALPVEGRPLGVAGRDAARPADAGHGALELRGPEPLARREGPRRRGRDGAGLVLDRGERLDVARRVRARDAGPRREQGLLLAQRRALLP